MSIHKTAQLKVLRKELGGSMWQTIGSRGSVVDVGAELRARDAESESWGGGEQKIFLFFITSTLALGSTQPLGGKATGA